VQVHGNSKLVPSLRLLLVRRVLEQRWKIADACPPRALRATILTEQSQSENCQRHTGVQVRDTGVAPS
jgi:hypothetical protein